MMIAMVDAAVTGFVPVIWWVAALVGGAMLLAAVRGRGRARADAAMSDVMGGGTAMAVHSATGMVVMAALMMSMTGGAVVGGAGPGGAMLDGGHAHHTAAPSLAVTGLVLGAAYFVASAGLAWRSRAALDRAQYAAMAGSVTLMSLALIA